MQCSLTPQRIGAVVSGLAAVAVLSACGGPPSAARTEPVATPAAPAAATGENPTTPPRAKEQPIRASQPANSGNAPASQPMKDRPASTSQPATRRMALGRPAAAPPAPAAAGGAG